MPILRLLLIVFVFIVVSVTGRADAAELAPADVAIEEQLNQGIAMRRAGNDEAALGVFLDLEKRAPDSVRLLLHIATAAQATGKWVMASEYLRRAESHKDDPYYQHHKSAIENVEKTIDQRVGQFRARGVPVGAEVRLSGEIVGTMPMSASRVVEVGTYLLEVTKPGYFPLRRPVTIAGGGNVTQEDVELRPQTPFLGPPGTAPSDVRAEPARGAAPPQAATGWRARWVTWALLGVGAAAGATSAVAFAIREQDVSHWNDPNRCLRPSQQTLSRGEVCPGVRRDIDTAGGIVVAAGVTGAVFGGAALVHWLATSHPSEAENREQGKTNTGTGTQTGMECTPGLGGFVCSGSF